MSNFDFDKRRQLREDDGTPTPCVPGGAYPQCGVTAPFQTPYNTVGIGNPVFGGSDRFDNIISPKKKPYKKKGVK